MARSLRAIISSKILETFNSQYPEKVLTNLQCALELKRTNQRPELHLSVADLMQNLDKVDGDHIKSGLAGLDSLGGVPTKTGYSFGLDRTTILEEAFHSEPVPHIRNKSTKILVEFSSPNIAKPFHMGHLRSTIIGNFVSKLFQRSQHQVHRINYLGDWGTQFGLLSVGMDMATVTDEQMRSNPIQHLFQAYVLANRSAEADPEVADKARRIFSDLENGIAGNLGAWSRYREYTVTELKTIYERLGVQYDEYCWESDYRRTHIQPVLDELLANGIMKRDEEGRYTVRIGNRNVPLIKSDGTTLYLSRDIAALKERALKHSFNRMLYVVDNGQHDHFNALFELGRQTNVPGISGAEHVKFGRIQGMSTRKGNVVFLTDILNEARDVMHQKQRDTTTTRIDVTSDHTADILGISAVIVNDLKQRRQRDYVFDWSKALQVTGDTGIKLQYTHCRLCSLAEATSHIHVAQTPNAALLSEPEAEHLIFELARYEEVVVRTQQSLEACVLVNYLFSLSNSISRALKRLNVRDHADADVQQQRVLMFRRAQSVLADGMRILGLKPLNKM